jgi:hypothetical protein
VIEKNDGFSLGTGTVPFSWLFGIEDFMLKKIIIWTLRSQPIQAAGEFNFNLSAAMD